MKLSFTGLSTPIFLAPDRVAVLEIHNKALFSRICSSLCSGDCENAAEPYSLWNDKGEELSFKNSMIVIASPLVLPWDDRRLVSGLNAKLEAFVLEDLARQTALEEHASQVRKCLNDLAFLLHSDYSLDVDWDLQRLLKVFNFGIDYDSHDSLLDKCIKFLSYVADTFPATTLVFINLRLFLLEKELIQLYEHAFFLNLKLLLVENVSGYAHKENEELYVVDQDFLESW